MSAPPPIPAPLSDKRWREAICVGVLRYMDRRRANTPHYGPDGHIWDRYIEGACAEHAVADYFHVDPGVRVDDLDPEEGDVAGWQVRWRPQHTDDLGVRPRDREDHCFILVTGRSPDLVIRGWARGAEGKEHGTFVRGDPKRGTRDCSYLPASYLHPMPPPGEPGLP